MRGKLLEAAGRPLAWRLVLLGVLVGIPCHIAAVVLFYQRQPILSYLFNQLCALPQSLLYLVVLLWIGQTDWLAASKRQSRRRSDRPEQLLVTRAAGLVSDPRLRFWLVRCEPCRRSARRAGNLGGRTGSESVVAVAVSCRSCGMAVAQ